MTDRLVNFIINIALASKSLNNYAGSSTMLAAIRVNAKYYSNIILLQLFIRCIRLFSSIQSMKRINGLFLHHWHSTYSAVYFVPD